MTGIQLDSAQQRIVGHTAGPLLVLAGPGTGKTTAIAEAAAARLRERSASEGPGSVLVLTFAKSAAIELRDRIAGRLGGGLLPQVSTFHSYCYSLLSEFRDRQALVSPRLLSAPEQEARLRELLSNAIKERRIQWPAELDPAVGTRGLASEVRSLIARAQSLGLDAHELEIAGKEADIPAWESISRFLSEYLDVLDAEGVLDYSELVARAVRLAESPDVGAILRRRYRAIYVDEFQDTDPAQVRLLAAITTPATALVAVGDPDQAIYSFRGADVSGILSFADSFADVSGSPAPIAVLGSNRRYGNAIRDAAVAVVRRVSLGTLPATVQRAHRAPECSSRDTGEVEVVTFDTTAAQAAAVADMVRRAMLSGQVTKWSQIAVIGRSAHRDFPAIAQALTRAGVPAEVEGEGAPLRLQPGIGPLLEALRLAAGAANLTPALAASLLCGPLGRMDAGQLRTLGRTLRAHSRSLGEVGLPSAELICAALADVRLLDQAGVAPDCGGPVRAVAGIVAAAREAIAGGTGVEQVLWDVWQSTDWPHRLRRAAGGSGSAGRAADRDLDAVVALFDLARRTDSAFSGRRALVAFLEEVASQSIAVTPSAAAAQRDAVTLTTAHRSKGLEWQQVFVVGVQEGSWPDLRVRGSLLAEDRLSAGEPRERSTVADMVDDERRLLFVACTRAKSRLVVTAVASRAEGGDQPSRFLDSIASTGSAIRRHEPGFRTMPLSMPAMVAELRAAAEDSELPIAVRQAAAARLAMLVSEGVSAADPRGWHGIRDWTHSSEPVRPLDRPVSMSGSSWASLDACSLRWFFEHEAKAQTARGPATAFGSVIHALADAVARGELAADARELTAAAERIWPSMTFEADWQSRAEFAEAAAALARFVNWHSSRSDRQVVGSEIDFAVEVEVPGDRVAIRGSADRVEIDSDGSLRIVDLKTGKGVPSAREVTEHRQLSLYQVAGEEGAFDSEAPVGGAELVQLRKGTALPKVQQQEAINSEAVREELGLAIEVIRSEGFSPSPSAAKCRMCAFKNVCPAQGRQADGSGES